MLTRRAPPRAPAEITPGSTENMMQKLTERASSSTQNNISYLIDNEVILVVQAPAEITPGSTENMMQKLTERATSSTPNNISYLIDNEVILVVQSYC